MRNLWSYSLKDWRRLRPLTQGYKSAIYRIQTAWHVRRSSAGLAALLDRIGDGDRASLAITIAFEAPWAIRHQIAAARRFFDDAVLVVCDNSRRDAAAREIEAICRDTGTPYLRLPRDPSKKGSRSHAMAINWAYRNVVCRAKPACFAFLDHDLFPTGPVNFAALVKDQPVHGRIRTAGSRWFLWAGYCVFDGRYAVRPLLDFSQDWFNGLDTGGANYRILYRTLDRAALSFASYRHEARVDPVTGVSVPVEVVDGWLHLTNVSGWDPERQLDADLLERIVTAASDAAGGVPSDLPAPPAGQ